MPQLPSHMYLGRGAAAGPLIGGYTTFNFGPFQEATTATAANLVRIVFQAPCDMRLQQIVWHKRTSVSTKGSECALALYKCTAIANVGTAASGTALCTSTVIQFGYTSTSPYGASAIPGTGAAGQLVATARDITKGHFIYMMLQRATATEGDLVDANVAFHFTLTGHLQTDSAND